MKKLILSFIAFFFSLTLVSADISISPLKFEYDIKPGQSKTVEITVENNGKENLLLFTSKEDFISSDTTGVPKFITEKNNPTSLINWIEIKEKTFTLAPDQTKKVSVKISVPKTGEPGGHYGAVFFSTKSPDSQLAVSQRIGTLVLLNVDGKIEKKADLTDFSFNNQLEPTFNVGFKNYGNVFLKPTGKIELFLENGDQLKNIGKESIVNDLGGFVGEKIVDYIPVNDSRGVVLARSERIFEPTWDGFGEYEKDEEGTKLVNFISIDNYFNNLNKTDEDRYLQFWQKLKTRKVSKPITAKLDLSYVGNNGEEKFDRTTHFNVEYKEEYKGINEILIFVVMFFILALSFIYQKRKNNN